MDSFSFSMSTHIEFGIGKIMEIGSLLSKFNKKNCLIIHGYSAEKYGYIDTICKSLDSDNINYNLYLVKIDNNPTLELVNETLMSIQDLQKNYDFIIAVGGGAIIDFCKALVIGIKYGNNIWDYYEGSKKILDEMIPIGVVLTNPASGSEVSKSTVLTNKKINVKRGCSSDFLIPKFTILDPSLLESLSNHQLACAVSDILMHTLERYLSGNSINELTDSIAEGLLKNVLNNGKIIFANCDKHLLGEIMWAGSLSNNGITGLGSKVEFPLHQIGHQISAFYNVIHAETLTSIWNAWGDYYYKTNTSRFAKLGKVLFGIDTDNEETNAIVFIREMTSFFSSIGMPVNLEQCGLKLSEEDIIDLTNSITNYGNRIVGNYWKMDFSDVKTILINSN